MDIYRVVWKDAQGGANMGWRDLEDLKHIEVAIAVSCGIILVDDLERLVICPHFLLDEYGAVEQGDAEIVIPKQWVVSCDLLEISA
jgi:hypothetical protein